VLSLGIAKRMRMTTPDGLLKQQHPLVPNSMTKKDRNIDLFLFFFR
jgi:hypothetical protein